MTKLTDLQSVLLTRAAGRADGSLYALPDSVTVEPARVMKAVTQLLRRGLLDEWEVAGATNSNRSDGGLRYGVFVTAAGLAAIGAEPLLPAAAAAETPVAAGPEPGSGCPHEQDDAGAGLARRDGCANLAELVEAAGWLPHTTRAALTGLRKKGHEIERQRRDGVSRYVLASAA